MKLLKELLKETAAGGSTGGGSIATVPGGLFRGGKPVRRAGMFKQKKGKLPVMKFHHVAGTVKEAKLNEFDQHSTATATDIISKLSAAEKEQEVGTKSVPFGLEDSEGNIVKVYIRPEQADDFENRLSMILNDPDEDHEIAEILFKMKDDFDVIHVDWGNSIPEDEEEQETTPAAAPQQGPAPAQDPNAPPGGDLGADPNAASGVEQGADAGALPGAEGDPGADAGDEMTPPDTGSEDKMQSTLDKVIDMLMADAEARKAEAQARAKEAGAKEAEAASRIANTKVSAEQEVLDMEAWSKRKKDSEKETRKLAQLAKYRHELSSKGSSADSDDDDSVTEI